MFRIAALLLMVGFYAIYYGKLLLQKKQGICTYQLKQQVGDREQRTAQLMGLATFLAPLGELTAILLNRTALPRGLRLLGLGLALAGDLIFLAAVTTMGASWRAGVNPEEKTELVTRGIYSVSRNPAFLGFDLVYVGVLLMFWSWWLLLLTLFAVGMLHLQILWVEEPYLPTAFGPAYRDYASRVCRYLGRRSHP